MSRLLLLAALAASLLLAAPVADASVRRPPPGFFGVMFDRSVATADAAAQDAQWNLMARSGVESVRTVFNWAAAQPTAGEPPSFATTDGVVGLAAARGIRLVPVVYRTPAWAALYPDRDDSPPARAEDYAAYLEALVRRYGPHGSYWVERPDLPPRPVREWQIWNEPHLDAYWHTDGNWAPEYAQLLRVSNATLERADPGSVTVLAGLADYIWLHLRELHTAGIRGDYDVAAMNLFTSRPRLVLKGLRLTRRELRRAREGRKPIWLTEVTWPASKGRVATPQAAWQRAWETTDRGMARRLVQLFQLARRYQRRLRLGRLYWYTWASSYADSDRFDYAGLIRYAGGLSEPTLALSAYSRIARRARGCRRTAAGTCHR